MQLIIDDGGRTKAGFKGKTGDCACRAAAIASGRPYKEIYDLINKIGKTEKLSKKHRGTSNARTGVHKITMQNLMKELGFKWKATMMVGQGCSTRLRTKDLPHGKIVVNLSKHYAAVVYGVLYDTYDSSREETLCVYGYWYKEDLK